MTRYLIHYDRDRCIGYGACWQVCPDNWKEGADGKADVVEVELDDISCNEEAAAACPVQAIKVSKVKDNK